MLPTGGKGGDSRMIFEIWLIYILHSNFVVTAACAATLLVAMNLAGTALRTKQGRKRLYSE